MGRFYERSSKKTAVESIDPKVRDAIVAHAEKHQLGDVLGAAQLCCVTRSVRLKRPGLLARLTKTGDLDAEHTTIALLLPRYLVVAVAGERRGIHVRSIRLENASIALSVPAVDTGIAVDGLWSGALEPASFHVGLGDDADGTAFLAALREAITEVKSA
ncbi:hypothetical protein [Actinomadura formosensis]|uniref:hypothetical protein n=1 Tax=Actinomadura formosensis TaxID=60706 RepID=UPI000A861F68|nr:hypothetical protein [Actinomadura formosensis]